MELGIAGDVAIVTGGASGIGWACVRTFLAEGVQVAVWDRRPIDRAILQSLSQEESSRIFEVQVDIIDGPGLHRALEVTQKKLGPIHHLVHAAAIGSGKFGFPFTHLTPEDWPKVLEINVMGMVHVAHVVAPILRELRRGTLCFLGSVAGQIGSQTDPPYSASKAANINFAQCMAKDLASSGVRVNVVNPGMVQTPLNRSVWQSWHDAQPADQRQSYEDWAGEKIRKVIPLGTWQTPEDIANAIVFLASPRARNITGQCINIDGGFVMHW